MSFTISLLMFVSCCCHFIALFVIAVLMHKTVEIIIIRFCIVFCVGVDGIFGIVLGFMGIVAGVVFNMAENLVFTIGAWMKLLFFLLLFVDSCGLTDLFITVIYIIGIDIYVIIVMIHFYFMLQCHSLSSYCILLCAIVYFISLLFFVRTWNKWKIWAQKLMRDWFAWPNGWLL